jgi:hypothetical protein
MNTHGGLGVAIVAVAGVSNSEAVSVWYAKPSPTGTGDCNSWANACGLNTATAAATSGDVWVKKGT